MFAEDTAGLMDVLGLATVDVAGMSMGGRIALELAATHPERVQRLVLISTSAAGTGKVHMSLPMRVLWLLQWIPGMQGKHPQPRFAHRRQRTAATTYDGTGRLGRVTCPTLILHGRQDRSIPLARARELQAGIPQAATARIPRRPYIQHLGGTPPGCRGNRHLRFLVSRPLGRPRLLLERCDRIRRAVTRSSCRQADVPQTDSRDRAPSVWCV
jgi:pimeloyl-ACP methyl ester carboxylesterase